MAPRSTPRTAPAIPAPAPPAPGAGSGWARLRGRIGSIARTAGTAITTDRGAVQPRGEPRPPAQPATRATAKRRRPARIGPARADWLPPAAVLVLQLLVGILVGANPLVIAAIALSVVGIAYLVWQAAAIEPSRAAARRRPQAMKVTEPAAVAVHPPAIAPVSTVPLEVHRPAADGSMPATPLPPSGSNPLSTRPRLTPTSSTVVFRGETRPPAASNGSGPVPSQSAAPQPPVEAELPTAPTERRTSDLRWLWGTILRDPTARPPRRDRN